MLARTQAKSIPDAPTHDAQHFSKLVSWRADILATRLDFRQGTADADVSDELHREQPQLRLERSDAMLMRSEDVNKREHPEIHRLRSAQRHRESRCSHVLTAREFDLLDNIEEKITLKRQWCPRCYEKVEH